MKAGACLTGFLLSVCAVHADWEMDRFMISAWGGPETEAMAQAYVDAGFNTVMAKAESLDLCRKYALSAIVFDGTPELAAKHIGDPAVWGWYVQDEPKEEEFARAAEGVARFHAADPSHPAYVNLMAWMPLDKYLGVVKPRFLSYDYYQWWWGTQNFCWRLEAHREAALKAGLPLICWVEANADPRHEWGKPGAGYLPDNAAKLRQSVFVALAYGVRGIQWFTGGLVFSKELDGQCSLTQSGQDIRAINRDVQALGPELMGLRSVGVYHTAPVPAHTQAVPEGLWVQARGRNITLGVFEDATRRRHLMVVNRDIERPRSVTLFFAEPLERLMRLEVGAGRWRPVTVWRNTQEVPAATLRLRAGDGVLLRVG